MTSKASRSRWQSKQKNIDATAKRVQARRDYIKAHGDPGPGKDIHHVKDISKGGGNGLSNLKAVAASKNRTFKRDAKRRPK